MEDIVTAIDKVIKKRKLDPTTRIINEHIALLEEWEREEASNPGRSEAEREGSLTKLKAKIAELDGPGVIKAYQKELVTVANKVSKVADKVLETKGIDAAVPPEIANSLDPTLVNIAIWQYLLQVGSFDVARKYIEAVGLVPARDASASSEESTSASASTPRLRLCLHPDHLRERCRLPRRDCRLEHSDRSAG